VASRFARHLGNYNCFGGSIKINFDLLEGSFDVCFFANLLEKKKKSKQRNDEKKERRKTL
jgi:hypothetical protein